MHLIVSSRNWKKNYKKILIDNHYKTLGRIFWHPKKWKYFLSFPQGVHDSLLIHWCTNLDTETETDTNMGDSVQKYIRNLFFTNAGAVLFESIVRTVVNEVSASKRS